MMLIENNLKPNTDDWDFIAKKLKENNCIYFTYLYNTTDSLGVLIINKWTSLPDDTEYLTNLVGVWCGGFDVFDIKNKDYENTHQVWDTMNLTNDEKRVMVQLLKALKTRI